MRNGVLPEGQAFLRGDNNLSGTLFSPRKQCMILPLLTPWRKSHACHHAGLVKFIVWVLHSIFSSLGNSILNIIGTGEQNITGQRISLCSCESRRYMCTAPQISNTQRMCHQGSWKLQCLTVTLLCFKPNITFPCLTWSKSFFKSFVKFQGESACSAKLETGNDQFNHLAFDQEPPPLGVTLSR